jgi:hypothetical protein
MKKTLFGQSIRFTLFAFALSFIAIAQKKSEPKPKPAQSIPELRQQLEKILHDTHTPGMSIAIVRRDGPEWVDGLGRSNVAAKRHIPTGTSSSVPPVLSTPPPTTWPPISGSTSTAAPSTASG